MADDLFILKELIFYFLWILGKFKINVWNRS